MIKFESSKFEKKDEKILLITVIGVLESLKTSSITLEEAEKYIFSPYMIRLLKDNGCKREILEILERGCELEDLVSLVPDSVENEINIMQQSALDNLKKYEKYESEFWLE